MQRQFTSGSRQAPDPYDQYLEEKNFYRKHTARDASCLFRVISEQMYDTQLHHLDIRKQCVRYMRQNSKIFQTLVDRDLDEYLDDMSKPKTHGSLIELQAIGVLFQRNVILFEPFNLGNYFHHRSYYHPKVFRVFYTPERHFDSVFTCDYIKDAAVCQSICYEILYKDLFKLPDVSYAVEHMLHSSSFETTNYEATYNDEGFCIQIRLNDGRFFKLDLPNGTNCILENYKLCHFHYSNFNEDIKMCNDANDCDKSFLNKQNDSLLPKKRISCVRQLLMEGITPFPYKVAKALDPSMYRNIEFDAWSEARKELKLQNWYHGDANFKVGAKCHVKLHKSENDLYTCHIQEISVEKGQCVVFVEKLGEKHLVPYDSLTPLPPDQFKPWTLPYRFHRHMQKYSSVRFTRHFNYRFKLNEQFSSAAHNCYGSVPNFKAQYYDDDNSKESFLAAGHRQSSCYYKLKQYTELEDFRTHTVEYCTMPLTVEHDIDGKGGQQNPSTTLVSPSMESCSRAPSRSSPSSVNINGETNSDGIIENRISDDSGTMENYEIQQENGAYVPIYAVQSYNASPDDYYNYGYESCMQPAPTYMPANNGGPVYYMCNPAPPNYPPPGNVYFAPSSMQPVIATNTATNNGPNNIYYSSQPYTVGAPPQIQFQPQPVLQQGHVNPTYLNNTSSTRGRTNYLSNSSSNGRINWDAKKSIRQNGTDLPSDVNTLRYFYNLGLELFQKCGPANVNDRNQMETVVAKFVSENLKFDESIGPETNTDPNNNNAANMNQNPNNSQYPGNTNKQNFSQRRFAPRYFNSKERQSSYQRNANNNAASNVNNSLPNQINRSSDYNNGRNSKSTSQNNSNLVTPNSRNHNNINTGTGVTTNNNTNNVALAVAEQSIQTSPIPYESVCDEVRTPNNCNSHQNQVVAFDYGMESNAPSNTYGTAAISTAPLPPANTTNSVYIQMPMTAAPPYNIYTTIPQSSSMGGITPQNGAYTPTYIGQSHPPPPATAMTNLGIAGMPPPQSSGIMGNSFYSVTQTVSSEGMENLNADSSVQAHCMRYPPPMQPFFFSPSNAANGIGGVSIPASTTTQIQTMSMGQPPLPPQQQQTSQPLAPSQSVLGASQGFMCLPSNSIHTQHTTSIQNNACPPVSHIVSAVSSAIGNNLMGNATNGTGNVAKQNQIAKQNQSGKQNQTGKQHLNRRD